MVVGDEGIFNIAKKQQEQMKILQITERLELEKANMAIDNLGVVSLDKYLENIKNNGNKVGEYEITSIERIEQGKATIVVDGKYQYIIEEENNGNIKITYETNIKNAKPVIKEIEIIEVTTSSAKLKVKLLNVNKYEIYINGSKEPKPQIEENKGKEEITITYNNLEQQKNYTIKVEAINKNGKVEEEKTIKTIEMADLIQKEVVYTKTNTNWTNKNVTTTISFNTDKNIEGYKIEYMTLGIDEEVTSEKLSKGTWLQYTTSGITSTQNERIYSRLNDGYNTTSYTSTEIKNIDKENPTISIELSSSNVTTKGFTLNVGTTDTLSGYSKIIWNYKKSLDTKYTSEEEVTTQMNGSTAGTKTQVLKSKTYDNLTSGTYNAYVEVYDVAGNKETSETINITLGTIENPGDNTATASPTDWTNGDVVVTLPTKSGFTTEYQIGTLNVNGTWTSGNTTSVSSNTTIYYRYNDGKNTGGYGTHTISNIDKQDPTIVLNITEIGTNNIIASVTSKDEQSGMPENPEYTFSIKEASKDDSTYTNKLVSKITWNNTNNGTYAFIKQGDKWISNNQGQDDTIATSTWTTEVSKDTDFVFKYKASSEDGYDYLDVEIDGNVIIEEESGYNDEKLYSGTLTKGKHTLTAKFSKDGSSEDYDDCAYIVLDLEPTQYQFTGLEPNKAYTIKVTSSDKAENIGVDIKSVTTAKKLVSYISLNVSTLSMKIGDVQTITAKVYPDDANNKDLTWESSDTNVAIVSNGIVTAKEKGTATITVRAQDGSGKTATCKVTITNPTLASKIKASDYGKKINYSANGINDWKVFYNDGTYVYIITSNNIPSSKIPSSLGILGSGYWSDTSYQKAGYDLNSSAWSVFASGKGAQDAVGTPTLNMWVGSWNAKGYTRLYINSRPGDYDKDEEYVYIGTSDNANSTYVSLNTEDTLYFPDGNYSEYWINEIPHRYTGMSSNSLYCVYDGEINNDYIDSRSGLRPVVRLKSDVTGTISDVVSID